MKVQSINPSTGEVIASYPIHTPNEVASRIHVAPEAFERHCDSTFSERTEKMFRIAVLLESGAGEFGDLMTRTWTTPWMRPWLRGCRTTVRAVLRRNDSF